MKFLTAGLATLTFTAALSSWATPTADAAQEEEPSAAARDDGSWSHRIARQIPDVRRIVMHDGL